MKSIPPIIVLIIAALAATARADIGPKPTSRGQNPEILGDVEGIEVAMASEDVRLHLVADDEGKDTLSVVATFHIRNPGEEVTLETGFPFGAFRNVAEFSVTAAGKPVRFDLVNRGDPTADMFKGKAPDYWYVWTATYPKGESVHVVRYRLDLSRHVGGGTAGYVLRSGAGWKGPIGKVVVTLTLGGWLTTDHLHGIRPARGARREADRIVWELKDLEPTKDDDIHVNYGERSRSELMADLRAKAESTWSGKLVLLHHLFLQAELAFRERLSDEEWAEYLEVLDAACPRPEERDGVLELPVTPEADGGDPYWVRRPCQLFKVIDRAVRAVEDRPGDERAREILARAVKEADAFLAGRLVAKGESLAPTGRHPEKQKDEIREKLAKAREALAREE